MKFEDQEDFNEELSFNVDVEFSSVEYIDIPLYLGEIEITRIEENIPAKFEHYKTSLAFNIFEIKSYDKLYYIIASGYIIGKNKWASESTISDMSLQYEEILYSSYK